MASTSLTLAGFTQPPVARSVIESAANFEKGLPQRFIWLFPKGTYEYLDKLEPINAAFTSALGMYTVCHIHEKELLLFRSGSFLCTLQKKGRKNGATCCQDQRAFQKRLQRYSRSA